jgi:hypothetical protein
LSKDTPIKSISSHASPPLFIQQSSTRSTPLFTSVIPASQHISTPHPSHSISSFTDSSSIIGTPTKRLKPTCEECTLFYISNNNLVRAQFSEESLHTPPQRKRYAIVNYDLKFKDIEYS